VKSIIRFNETLNVVLTVAGGVSLVVMTAIACVNMILRLLGTPLAPAYELVSYCGAITVALPLGYTQVKRAHISVDILSSRFPDGVRKTAVGTSMVLGFLFFSAAARKVGQHATTLWLKGELSETTRMPFYPFTYAVAVSCGIMAFCLLLDVISMVFSQEESAQ
jgi:TRAP-type C4-dicarboxylate transport system permease small subunit